MKALVFPGQGAQTPGMGKSLYDSSEKARALYQEADRLLGFSLTDVMFNGSEEDLRQTRVTQPAVFLDSVTKALCQENLSFDMTAGHSLGEFSALTVSGALSFKDGLLLVSKRAQAMQQACQMRPSGMAAVLNLDAEVIEGICKEVTQEGEVVVAANYNCPGQIVISGTLPGIETACKRLMEAGARRAIPLKVSGAFHSPLMLPAKVELEKAILETEFNQPACPVYQNIDALPHTDPEQIKANLVSQLTGSVKWMQIVERMIQDGATSFTESGPGTVLQGLIRKTNRDVEVSGI